MSTPINKGCNEKFGKSGFDVRLPIAKLDAAKGLVTGWAALTTDTEGNPVFDYQDEYSPLAELEKATHELVLAGGAGKAGEMHQSRVGDLVAAMVLDKEKVKELTGAEADVGGLAVTLKIRDPAAIERIKNGERSELSIHGLARKTPIGKRADGTIIKALSDIAIDEISIVDQGASGNENAQPRIVIAKRREENLSPSLIQKIKEFFSKQEQPKMTLDEALAMCPEDVKAVILAAMEQLKAAPAPAPAPIAEPVAMQAPSEEENKEEMAKALAKLPEPVRKQIEKLEAESEERQELKKRLDKIEQEREFAGFVEKAKALPFLAGKSTEQIAKLLQSAHKSMDKKDIDVVEKVLQSANDVVRKSALFVDRGSPFSVDDETPSGKLEAVAKLMVDKDPSMNIRAARIKAAELHPELYAQRNQE